MTRDQLEGALDGIGVDDSDKAYVLMKFDQAAPPAPSTEGLSAGVRELHAIVAGALFDLLGGMTSGTKEYHLSGHHEATVAVEAIDAFARLRGLRLDEADVNGWSRALAAVQGTT